MSTATPDYAALANQARGVDYSAVADRVRQEDQKGFLQSFSDSSGLSALAHPIDSIMGIPAGLKQMAVDSYQHGKAAIDSAQREGLSLNTRRQAVAAIPILGSAVKNAQDQYDAGNGAGAAGTLAGTVLGLAGPKAIGALKDAPEVAAQATAKTAETMQGVGEAAQSAGNKLVNETVGSYKSDFKRGANPGRGYNSTGQGVSWTMRQLASKAENAKQSVGSQIQKVISASADGGKGLVPIQDVLDTLSKPLKDAYDSEVGPGGMGNTGAFEQYAQQFKDVIAKGIKQGGLTTQEVFDLKKSIAQKAKFNNTTPEGIMDVRQSQVGALGGLLKDRIPSLAPLNQAYQDLVKLADRAQWRAESGSVPLRRLITEGAKGATGVAAAGLGGAHDGLAAYGLLSALDSTAGRTSIASALYKGGQTIGNAGSKLEAWLKGAR